VKAGFSEAAARYGKDAGEMTVCKVIEDDAGLDLRVAWVAMGGGGPGLPTPPERSRLDSSYEIVWSLACPDRAG